MLRYHGEGVCAQFHGQILLRIDEVHLYRMFRSSVEIFIEPTAADSGRNFHGRSRAESAFVTHDEEYFLPTLLTQHKLESQIVAVHGTSARQQCGRTSEFWPVFWLLVWWSVWTLCV